jgi:hypothetical protein
MAPGAESTDQRWYWHFPQGELITGGPANVEYHCFNRWVWGLFALNGPAKAWFVVLAHVV